MKRYVGHYRKMKCLHHGSENLLLVKDQMKTYCHRSFLISSLEALMGVPCLPPSSELGRLPGLVTAHCFVHHVQDLSLLLGKSPSPVTTLT